MENLQSLNPNRSRKALVVLKSIIVIFLLPWVYSFTFALLNESKLIEANLFGQFNRGVITFLVVYLFIYAPGKVYQKGQKITEATFRFISPLVKVAPFILPIYSILLFLLYFLIFRFMKSPLSIHVFMFFIGFSFMFHITFTARTLHSRKDDFLMINYLFSFSIIYIINLSLLALGFSVLFPSFSWLNFSKSSFQIAKGIFLAVFNQLFL